MPVDRPTFSESWYRVADMRPRLRPTVQVRRQHFRGQMWYVIQDPSNNQFFRLNDAAYKFIALLEGRRTVAEVWKICNEELGDNAPTQGEAIQLMGQLYVSNLLLSEVPPDTQSLLNRYRKRVNREIRGYLTNLLFIRIPLFDPDRFLDRWVSLFGKVFSIPGLILLIGMICAGLYALGHNIDRLISDSSNASFGQEGILSPENLPYLYLCFALVKVFHEFGHAFSCKKFGLQEGSGGEVHVLGIMFLVFAPFPYVDASSSWALRSKWHRAVVGAAGVLVELGIASIAAIVWANTADTTLANKLAYNVMFIAGVSTILFNGNPLLRYDGYYILSDLLEIPNLAQRSKEYIYYVVRKYVWGVRQVRNPAHTQGERAWMIAYGISSTIYRVFICAAILLFVADQLFMLGAVLAIAAVFAWVMVPLGKFFHYLFNSPELLRVRSRAIGSTFGVLVALIVGIGIVPWSDYEKTPGVVEPAHIAMIYAETPGFVLSSADVVPTDTKVVAKQTLVSAVNHELELLLTQRKADLRKLEAERREASDKRDWSTWQGIETQIEACKTEIQGIQHRLDSLKIKTPITGEFYSPTAEKLPGAYINSGDQIGLVGSMDDVIIRVVVGQEIPSTELKIGDRVELRIQGRPPQYRPAIAGQPAGQEPEMTGVIYAIHQ
ncbi:MAG: hypothetical protein EHM48_07095, partial [Planctomycetaceae bacterium]